jgi:hypothetical protein
MGKTMKFKGKVKNDSLWVKVRLSSSDLIDERELVFLSQNKIVGFLKLDAQKKDTLTYVGTAGLPLAAYLVQKKISKYVFFHIMAQIVEAARIIIEKQFSFERLALDLNYVYIIESTKELQFLYLPVQSDIKFLEVKEFMEKVLRSLSPAEDAENYVADFMDFMKTQNEFELDAIDQFIAEGDADVAKQIARRRPVFGSSSLQTKNRDVQQEGTELFEKEGTIQLPYYGAAVPESASLIHLKDGEKIAVNKEFFSLGTQQGNVNYCIGGNSTVSRSHAQIIKRNQMYFVKDLNSTNHTYVNGEYVMPGKEIQIFDGDVLMLSDEEFEFHV